MSQCPTFIPNSTISHHITKTIGVVFEDWNKQQKNIKEGTGGDLMGATKASADELLDKGGDFFDKGKWDHALECWERANVIYEELGDKRGISSTLNNIGSVYYNRGEWGLALEYYERSLTISEKLGDKRGISSTLNNIGSVYYNRGEWGRALEYYEKSLTISEELGDKQVISITLNNIGVVYYNRGEWGRALGYYEKSLTIAEELGDKQVISTTLNNIGEINMKNGDLDEAKINLEKSLPLAEELAPISTVYVLANLSELWRLDDRYDDAFATLEKALQIVRHAGARQQEIGLLEKLAETYISRYLVDKEVGDLSSSEEFYIKALELARSLKMLLREAITIRGIGIVQAKKGDVTASKKSFKESIETLRSLGAIFELQKTSLEYARALYENNDIVEAEIVAKSAAFDALRNDYHEPLVKTYLLLGDIAMSRENQYRYYLDCLKVAEFNPKIYVKTCFFLIFRMKKMEKQVLVKFTTSLKEVNKDKSFDNFLDALNARIADEKYDTAGLPSSLVEELKSFTHHNN